MPQNVTRKILLGSKSPRRNQLLGACNIDFEIAEIDTEEIYDDNMNRYDVPVFLSQKKSNAYIPTLAKNEILITCDTVVICENIIFEKPKSKDEAVKMLLNYRNKSHDVVTGVTLRSNSKSYSFYAITKVYFNNLKIEDINYYVDNFEPYDKAGAYGIQEFIGHIGIEKIEGSYNNVVGLPTEKLIQELEKF